MEATLAGQAGRGNINKLNYGYIEYVARLVSQPCHIKGESRIQGAQTRGLNPLSELID